MRKKILAAAAVAVWSGAGAVLAGALPEGGVTGAEVVAALQDKGYRAELTTDSTGDPMIQSAAEGVNFRVFFYECEGDPARCSAIQLVAAFDLEEGLALDRINLWNREHRFGRGYLDDENDPFVEMDLDVEYGFTTEALANNLDTWVTVLPGFKEFIGF
jgi:hypothetical protein